jgi:hypothetical protein
MNNYKEQEQRIALAVKHLSTKTKYNLSAEARLFNVDAQRLRRRLNAPNSKSTRPPTNQQLNPTQLKALELYIDRLNQIGQPPLISMWRAAADSIRRSTTTPAEYALLKPLRRDFFKRYIHANRNIKKVRQKPQEVARLAS